MTYSKKARYNLNLVLLETGIKADTLRAWERRYNLPQPARTKGGHRLFSDYDIATIKWLQSRQNEGLRIGQAVEMWRDIIESGKDPLDSMRSAQDSIELTGTPGNHTIAELSNNWVEACLNYDEITADQILNQSFAQFSFEAVCANLIIPSLVEIGSLWYRGDVSVQQEHFASELAVRKIQALISSAPKPIHTQRIMVGCAPGELHTISSLMTTLLLKYRGWDVIYLGSNVPEDRILNTVLDTHPSIAIITAAQLNTAASLLNIIELLQNQSVPVAFSGYIFTQIDHLSELIPGIYLGSSLIESIPIIESHILNPQSNSNPSIDHSIYIDTLQAFNENKASIEAQVYENINSKSISGIPLSSIQGAITFLSQDILAALSLGDIALLNFNLKWIQGLISNHQLPQDRFQEFLSNYRSAVEDSLGVLGEPILTWFESILK